MITYNLLEEKIISADTASGIEHFTLPGLLAGLLNRKITIEGLSRIQIFQRHAVYSFLVQLTALAYDLEMTTELYNQDETYWKLRLLSLSSGRNEPWSLIVEDTDKPAFMQPVTTQKYNLDKNLGGIEILSVLITGKNFDVKTKRHINPTPEDWMYALITLQTMQGFLGLGNYGIARMNGGFGSRPCMSFSSGSSLSERFRHDTEILITSTSSLAKEYSYDKKGIKLLWLESWDGTEQLALSQLHPYFIEICRLVRLYQDENTVQAAYCISKTTRINAKEAAGNTGDPWAPFNKDGKLLTLPADGFTYKRIAEHLLFTSKHPLCLNPDHLIKDTAYTLTCQCLVRGQGITEGYHERYLYIPAPIITALKNKNTFTTIADIAKTMIEYAETTVKESLRYALLNLFQGAPEKIRFDDARKDHYATLFHAEVDKIFFKKLFDAVQTPAAWQKDWLDTMSKLSEKIYQRAVSEVSIPISRRYRALAKSSSVLYFTAKKIKEPSSGDTHAE